MERKQIEEMNKDLEKIDFKGRDYVTVNARVAAFRRAVPGGLISTEILPELTGNGIVTMKATVADEEGSILATGLAQEKQGSTFVNKTSYIENCETSAVGRALGFLGVGIDDSMASAEELANAVKQQDDGKTKPKAKKKKKTARDEFLEYIEKNGLSPTEIAEDYGLSKESKEEDFKAALKKITERFGA